MPTAVQRVRGNPGKRALNPDEPAFQAGAPRPPRGLSAPERRHWRAILAVLEKVPGLLTVADQGVLESLARHSALAEKLWGQYSANAVEFVKDPGSGRTIKNPYLELWQEEDATCRRLGAMVGLDPSSRSRLQIKAPPERKKTAWEALRVTATEA